MDYSLRATATNKEIYLKFFNRIASVLHNHIYEGLCRPPGYLELVNRCISMTPHVNIEGVVRYNGVLVYVRGKRSVFSARIEEDPSREGGIAGAHRRLTRLGDEVVVVGGGFGVTAVIAALQVGEMGRVTVYEGGEKSVHDVERTLELNEVSDVCDVLHAVVGDGIDVYGGDASSARHISPRDLPDCDVLELDCEGSEVEILKNITIRPRVIIIEVHPWLFSEHPEWIIAELECRDYRIVWRSGHNGIEISSKELEELLRLSNPPCKAEETYEPSKEHEPSNKHKWSYPDSNGATWPVVIAAVTEER